MYSFGEHCNQVEQEGRESTINELDDYDDDTIQVYNNVIMMGTMKTTKFCW